MEERAYAFHQWKVAEVAKHFDVEIDNGLSETKASFRLAKNGLNSLHGLNPLVAEKSAYGNVCGITDWINTRIRS
jgi:hypothetical protein